MRARRHRVGGEPAHSAGGAECEDARDMDTVNRLSVEYRERVAFDGDRLSVAADRLDLRPPALWGGEFVPTVARSVGEARDGGLIEQVGERIREGADVSCWDDDAGVADVRSDAHIARHDR